jgi:hypothetical protein
MEQHSNDFLQEMTDLITNYVLLVIGCFEDEKEHLSH